MSEGKLIKQLPDLRGQWLVSDVGMTFFYTPSDEPEPFDVGDHRESRAHMIPLVSAGHAPLVRKLGQRLGYAQTHAALSPA